MNFPTQTESSFFPFCDSHSETLLIWSHQYFTLKWTVSVKSFFLPYVFLSEVKCSVTKWTSVVLGYGSQYAENSSFRKWFMFTVSHICFLGYKILACTAGQLNYSSVLSCQAVFKTLGIQRGKNRLTSLLFSVKAFQLCVNCSPAVHFYVNCNSVVVFFVSTFGLDWFLFFFFFNLVSSCLSFVRSHAVLIHEVVTHVLHLCHL